MRIRPRGDGVREHPIAGSSLCTTRLEGHLATSRSRDRGRLRYVRIVLTVRALSKRRGDRSPAIQPRSGQRSDVPGVMQQQTFSTLKCGWRQSWGWLATTRSIQALFAEGREHGRTIPLNCGAAAHTLPATGRVEDDPRLSRLYNRFYVQGGRGARC